MTNAYEQKATGLRFQAVLAVVITLCVAFCVAWPLKAQAAELQTDSGASLVTQSNKTASTKATQKKKVHKVKTAAQWHNISKYKGGTFVVTKDIKLKNKKQYLYITKNKKYTIDLNGHKVQTTYTGKKVKNREAPLEISKGTVTIKGNAKGEGVLRSTEVATVWVTGTGKLVLKSGTINNDFKDYNNTSCSVIFADKKGSVTLNGGNVTGIVHGVFLNNKAKLTTTGAGTATYPYIRGKDGCGIGALSKDVKLTLKGGSIGTAASPDLFGYAMSGWYPVLTKSGVLKTAPGCKYVDGGGDEVNITSKYLLTYGAIKRLTTNVKDPLGYYTVYVVKA